MKKKTSFGDVICKIEEILLSYSIILMAIILIGNVISRTIFQKSWSFAEEVGQTLVIITTFIGVGYAARKNKHISMSAIYDMLPEKVQKAFMLIISSVTSISLFYLSYLSIQYTKRVKELMRVTPALRIPMYLICGLVSIGFIVGGIEYLITFINNIKNKEIYYSSEKLDSSIEEDLTTSNSSCGRDNI